MTIKYKKIVESLREEIHRLDPGQRLPSIRQLGKINGVSQFTVQRAMEVLEREGTLVRKSAVGVYRAGVEPSQRRLERSSSRILLLAPDEWDMNLPKLIRRELIDRGFLCHICRYNLQESPATWLPRLRCQGVVFIGHCPLEMLQYLQRKHTPLVAQGIQYTHLGIDHTCGDERFAGELAAKHLLDLGHRKLAVLMNEPHASADAMERTEGFLNYARLADVTPILLDAQTQYGQDCREQAGRRLEEELAAGPLSFTGLFVVSDPGAMGALQVLYKHHIRVPDQISVIGSDNIPESAYLSPSLTTLAFDLKERAGALVDVLEQRILDNPPGRIRRVFRPYLVQRDSTAAPLKSM